MNLEEVWADLRPADPALGAELLRRWREPHRRYHTVEHLAFVLEVIERHAALAADLDAVRLAAWFHDAVYDPAAPDNEERSAELARAAGASPEVVRLIRLTQDHKAVTGDANGGLLCDADLAILATDPADYAAYAAKVREEYAFVPDAAYRVGRREVLQHLLDLPALFHVVPNRDAWTARAHTNLSAEIDRLIG
jgi:predicted metal-dependent HD superfamily phosphohydrolase